MLQLLVYKVIGKCTEMPDRGILLISWSVLLLWYLLLFVDLANWIWLDIYLGDSQADYQTLDTIKLV